MSISNAERLKRRRASSRKWRETHREQNRASQRAWKKANPEKAKLLTERARKKRQLKMRALIDQLKGDRCRDCKKKWPSYVLQFDHVRGKKEFTLADARWRTFSEKRIRAEAAKCESVCANCHAERTFGKGD